MQVVQLYVRCKNQANPVNVASLSPSSFPCNHSKLFVSQNFITLEIKIRKNRDFEFNNRSNYQSAITLSRKMYFLFLTYERGSYLSIFNMLEYTPTDIYEQYGALHSIVIFLAPMNISLIRIKSLNYLRKPRADFPLCYSVKEYESELFTLHLQWQGVNWMKYSIINWKLSIETFWTNFLSWLNFIMTTIPIEN